MNTEHNITSCPDCNGPVNHHPKRGESVCAECGVVVNEDTLDHGPEWSAYTTQEYAEKSRVGRPTTEMLHDKGLSTQIGWKNQDGYGDQLSTRKRRQMQRLRRWDERCRATGSERTLRQALGEINRMASALGLPQTTRETAGVIYRRAIDANLIMGRSIEGVASAAVYAATRQHGVPRSLNEIEIVARIEKRRFARDYRLLNEKLDLAMAPPDPTEYLPRFASELGLPHHAQRLANELLEAVIDTPYMSGKNPVSIAAAALYASVQLAEDQLTPDEQLTQREVSDVTDITKMTIRTHYRDIIELHEQTGGEVSGDG